MNTLKEVTCVCVLAACMIACNNKMIVSRTTNENKLRVLGYLPGSDNWVEAINSIDLTKITDLNLAFINPDTAGNFSANDAYHQIIQKAHNNNVRVFLSIGGGGPPAHLGGLLINDRRANLISGLVKFAETYDFDGIDVDLENALINADYAPFVSELSVALKAKNKLMTAALASWNSDLIGDSTLRLYDFINIMSYDKTGPWNLNKPGQHSPFTMTQDDFKYFNQTRKIPADKLFIGLPFYGYGFGNGAPQSMKYKDIIATFPGAENKDTVVVTGGGTIYYNGIATIKQKVSFAIDNKAGGVMIWQLLGDSKDFKSLLKVISDTKK